MAGFIDEGGGGNWTESSGNVYRDTGNVGIGDTSPSDKLVVKADDNSDGTVIADFQSSTQSKLKIANWASSSVRATSVVGGTFAIDCFQLLINTNNGAIQNVVFDDTGRTSIGVNNLPTAKLSVRGDGATSATTALLVENSATTALVTVRDDGLATFGGDVVNKVHVDDISNPPTDAELDAIHGTPATVGTGFTAYHDDGGNETNTYLVISTGTAWQIFSATTAA